MSLTWGEKPSGAPVLRRLRLADAPRCHPLTQAVGWGTSLADWERVLRWGGRGCFALEQDGELIATTTTTSYGRDRAWIGMVITHPDTRGRGHARFLMQTALDYLAARGIRHILLDASEMGRPLYEKLGFKVMYGVEVWTGRASSYLGPRARPLRAADLPAVIALDADVFGVARERILRRVVADSPHLAWVDDENGQIDRLPAGHGRPGPDHAGAVDRAQPVERRKAVEDRAEHPDWAGNPTAHPGCQRPGPGLHPQPRPALRPPLHAHDLRQCGAAPRDSGRPLRHSVVRYWLRLNHLPERYLSKNVQYLYSLSCQ